MSSPSPPKPQEINPYEGVTADQRMNEARQALGMDNIEDDDDMRKVKAYIWEQDKATYLKDPDFVSATNSLAQEGRLSGDIDYRYHDKDSFDAWAKKEGLRGKELNKYIKKKESRYGGSDWYSEHGGQAFDIQERDLSMIQGRMEETKYAKQSGEQQSQLQKQYEQMRADQQKDADVQRKMMEEMMNQPVYMPKQQQMPMVQKPQVQNDPILPAPAPNTPMSIAAPPAPELVNTGSRMAIVRTPASTQARSRRASRGTSKLTN
jgi:hypothetical protein